jgi:Fe-S cluster biogenesis protein NfuA
MDGDPGERQTLIDQPFAKDAQQVARAHHPPTFDGEPANSRFAAPARRFRRGTDQDIGLRVGVRTVEHGFFHCTIWSGRYVGPWRPPCNPPVVAALPLILRGAKSMYGRSRADAAGRERRERLSDMFIQTEETPNPATLKFVPGVQVMVSGTIDFADSEAATQSPLAERLFAVEGVTRIFFGSDFITVTKAESQDWHVMKPAILGVIMEHFTTGRPILTEAAGAAFAPVAGGGTSAEGEDDEVVLQIKDLLDTRVRPAVAMDGGDIVFHGFEEGVVYLHMQGACAGCPSSTATLKSGIENLLRHYVPEVVEVRAV